MYYTNALSYIIIDNESNSKSLSHQGYNKNNKKTQLNIHIIFYNIKLLQAYSLLNCKTIKYKISLQNRHNFA